MKIFFTRILYISLIINSLIAVASAQSWRDNTAELVYMPRYFGPNAFPIVDLHSGAVGSRWELEVRGEMHRYTGDDTRDIYARLYIPVVKERVAVELCGVVVEDYVMTPETRDERHAVETESPITCYGDLIVNTFFQLLRSESLFDLMVDMHLKTASGSRLCDARYTDAASYGFNITAGRNIAQNASRTFAWRLQGMAGFYCWMTNDMVHRQNDAITYGAGTSLAYRNISLAVDYSGFNGYKNAGDRPAMIRTKFDFEYRKNIISLRYKHGVHDYLYDTYSIGYIRCF